LGLRSTTADYKYSHNGTDFFLNICGGLVSPHLKCPMSSSACEIDKNKYPNGASLGDYHTMRFFHNKHMDQHVIVARFVNGTNGMSMTLEFFFVIKLPLDHQFFKALSVMEENTIFVGTQNATSSIQTTQTLFPLQLC